MRKIKRNNWKVQRKMSLDRKAYESLDLDSKVSVIEAFIPIGLMAIEELLYKEVEELAGPKHKCKEKGKHRGYRWGTNPGSVFLGESKVGIEVPRVRNRVTNEEVPLRSYKLLNRARKIKKGIVAKLLGGLSLRRYSECAEIVPEVFGISPSSLSRRFIEATEEKLKAFSERRLEGEEFVALFIDGKSFSGENLLIVLGVTIDGRKIPIGFRQGATEHHQVCADLLNDLIDRGLSTELGLLVVIDGSKGIYKAVKSVLADNVVIQRCQWHKRENVLSYLPKGKQLYFRKKLQEAYSCSEYKQAKKKLYEIRCELESINLSAVRSLDEGLKETLTIQRLGVVEELGVSFKTTNCIESLISQVARLTGRVSHWKNSNQIHRWLASSLFDLEPRMRRVKGYRSLWKLREALQKELKLKQEALAA